MSNLIGERLGGWRSAKGLSQTELARRAGLPQAAVSAVESGQRDCSLRTLFRLADGLGISPGTLLDKDPPRPILTRIQLDAVSRAVVTGRRHLPPAHRRLADACAAAVRPSLEASAAPGAARARLRGERALRSAERRFGSETVALVLGRIDKHLGAITP